MSKTQIWLLLIGLIVVCVVIVLHKAKLVEPAPTLSGQSRALLFLAMAAPFVGWAITWLLKKFNL